MATRKRLEVVANLKDSSAMLAMAEKMGEMNGLIKALLSEQSRLNAEFKQIRMEIDIKHAENLKLIRENHADNQRVLAAHQVEDNKNFASVSTWMNRYAGGIAAILLLLGGLWTVLTYFWPFVSVGKLKLGE